MSRVQKSARVWMISVLVLALIVWVSWGLRYRTDQHWVYQPAMKLSLPKVTEDLHFYMASNDLWPGQPISTYVFRSDDQVVFYVFQDQAIQGVDLALYHQPGGATKSAGVLRVDGDAAGDLAAPFSITQPGRIALTQAQYNAGGRLVIYEVDKQSEWASVPLPLIRESRR